MHMVAFPPSSTALAVPLWRFLTFTLIRALVFQRPSFFALARREMPHRKKIVRRIAGMHKKALKPAQGSTISISADASCGFSPSTTALAVPLWRFLTFTITRALVFRWPSFFAQNLLNRQKLPPHVSVICISASDDPHIDQTRFIVR